MDVALTIGGSFLSSVLQVMFDRMAPRDFWNLFKERHQHDQILKKLKRVLLALNMVLDDAENKQAMNKHIKNWLDELKDAIYEAEDFLDEINSEILRLKVTHHPLFLSNYFLDEIMPKIEENVSVLEDFVQEIDVLGLEKGGLSKQTFRLPSTCLVDESAVYGRDDETLQLIEMILSDEGSSSKNFDVVPIVGLGGVGKTTVAQVVYNDERVKNHFDVCAWVCVSEEYNAFKVTKTLLMEVTSGNSDGNENFNLLQLKLRESLTGKRFLFVLDDLWSDNYDEWDKLRCLFRDGAPGSKIIVTTRDERVSLMMVSKPVRHLQPISLEDSWSLFHKHTFENKDFDVKFEAIGKEIVKKCKGLPLAIKTLGGVLRSKMEITEWNDVLQSEIWDLPDDHNNILPALRLSYNRLPSYLKQCFAYCAIFPKDYSFGKDEVIMLWMANSLLEQPGKKRMEDIGDEYFTELRLRSFFQLSDSNKFLMHDLVNDLAKSVSGDFCARFDYNHQPCGISLKVRHFSYVREYHYDGFEKFTHLNDANQLRTFLPISMRHTLTSPLNKVLLDQILPSLRSLRVLSLSDYGIVALPESVGSLKHLRFLDLSNTMIRQLPATVINLYNLQSIFLYGCKYLIQLPTELAVLINLRHLDIRGTQLRKMPIHMSRLKSLQNLTHFVVGKESGLRIEEIGGLHQLHGQLTIQNLQYVANGKDALKASLKSKKYLEDLVLEWNGVTDDSQNDLSILDSLQPHENIKIITIIGYGGTRFADWLGDHSFSNVVSVFLRDCVHCFSLPLLGQLTTLKHLKIRGMVGLSRVGSEFYGDGTLQKPFESLTVLWFEEMLEWEEWDILRNGEFSNLEELCMINCPKLNGKLPNPLPSLTKFKMSNCSKLLDHLDQVRIFDSQVDFSHHLHLLEKLNISSISNLEELSVELSWLSSLEMLTIMDCPMLATIPDSGLPTGLRYIKIERCQALHSVDIQALHSSLRGLVLIECKNLVFPSDDKMESCFNSLEFLEIRDSCDSLVQMPLGLFPKLNTLHISHCQNLQIIVVPQGFQYLPSLHSIEIKYCDNLISCSKEGLPAPNLSRFLISNCMKLGSLPGKMHVLLPSLQYLSIVECPETQFFPVGGLPSSVEILSVSNYKKLVTCQREWGLQKMLSLRVLKLGGIVGVSFPDAWLLPCTLKFLFIEWHPNLITLNHRGLQFLNILETLRISHCPRLNSLPEGLPSSLSFLDIFNCPLLNPRLQREEGEDWPKIAYIRCVMINREIIM